ncbi:MAG: flagellar hook-length control protein FliK [Phycisphaeraceae bacterium]
MSVGSLSQQNAKALDLFAPMQAPAEPRVRPDRTSVNDGRDGGFTQALRESSSNRDGRDTEAAQSRGKAERIDAEPAEQTNPSDNTKSADDKPAAQGSDHEAEQGKKPDEQTAGDPKADAGQAEGQHAEQALGEASANAEAQAAQAAAQLQAPQQQPQAEIASSQAQAQTNADAAASNAKQQAQAALQHAGQQSQAQAQAQQNAHQTQVAPATAVQPIVPQSGSDDAGDDAPRHDTSSASQVGATAKSAGNAAASNAVFNLPAQPPGEARLNISPSANTAAGDATKAMQAQPTAPQADGDAVNTARLSRGLANAVQQRGGAVTLRLTPPEMGTVRIQMQITGTSVSASFHAESASAQTLLSQQLGQLRTALESQGMNVEKLSVQPLASASASNNAGQSQNNNQNDDNTQQQNQAQNQSANDGRSRGQYSGSSDPRQQGQDAATQQHQAQRGFFDQLEDASQPAAHNAA